MAIMSLLLLMSAALPVWAQTTHNRPYDNRRRGNYDRRNANGSFIEERRDKLTVAAGAGVGAIAGVANGGSFSS
jgi:hypothetical protein